MTTFVITLCRHGVYALVTMETKISRLTVECGDKSFFFFPVIASIDGTAVFTFSGSKVIFNNVSTGKYLYFYSDSNTEWFLIKSPVASAIDWQMKSCCLLPANGSPRAKSYYSIIYCSWLTSKSYEIFDEHPASVSVYNDVSVNVYNRIRFPVRIIKRKALNKMSWSLFCLLLYRKITWPVEITVQREALDLAEAAIVEAQLWAIKRGRSLISNYSFILWRKSTSVRFVKMFFDIQSSLNAGIACVPPVSTS